MNYSNLKRLFFIVAFAYIFLSCRKEAVQDVSYPGTGLTSVTISGTTWAPVNLGYITGTRPYGLLFQWGRMYGQEYVNTNVVPGPVAIGVGNSSANSSSFYTKDADPFDWCTLMVASWDMATYNPCPLGWRVPVVAELNALNAAGSTWVDAVSANPDGLPGRWFGGNHSGDHVGSIFLPAAGLRNVVVGAAVNREMIGDYWSSEVSGNYAFSLNFLNSLSAIATDYRAGGLSIRCVKQ